MDEGSNETRMLLRSQTLTTVIKGVEEIHAKLV
jgi:hypothetical protein